MQAGGSTTYLKSLCSSCVSTIHFTHNSYSTHNPHSRTSEQLELSPYTRRSADYAWQLVLASAAIMVRLRCPSLHPISFSPTMSITADRQCPTLLIRIHPPLPPLHNLPLLRPRPPGRPNLLLRPHHPPHLLPALRNDRHGSPHGRTRSSRTSHRRCCSRTSVVVGCLGDCKRGTRRRTGGVWEGSEVDEEVPW